MYKSLSRTKNWLLDENNNNNNFWYLKETVKEKFG